MKQNFKQKLLAGLLSVCMMFQTVGTVPVYAAENVMDSGLSSGTSNVCTHHVHDEKCGYTEGTPCTHEHTEECSAEVTKCVHEHTAECYPAQDSGEATASEAKEPTACTHQCSAESGCITKELACQHVHDDKCGYKEGSPCTFDPATCESCKATDSNAQELPKESIAKVQALMDALPTLEALQAVTDKAEQNNIYTDLQTAYDAYQALTKEEQAEVTGAEVFEALFNYFNTMTETLAQGNGNIVLTESSEALTFTSTGYKLGSTEYTYSGNYTLSGTTNKVITFADSAGICNVTMNNLTVNVGEAQCAIDLSNHVTANITLTGANSITGYTMVGIAGNHDTAIFTVTEASTGSLNMVANYEGGTLGGDANNKAMGIVNLNGGTITVTNHNASGNAIGVSTSLGKVNINGANVTAVGKSSTKYAIANNAKNTIGGNSIVRASSPAGGVGGEGSRTDCIVYNSTDGTNYVGTVYGTVEQDTLTVGENDTLLIPAGASLTVNGAITDNGKIHVMGTLAATSITKGADAKLYKYDGGTINISGAAIDAAEAAKLDITNGSITIEEDGYTQGNGSKQTHYGTYEITGTSTSNGLTIKSGSPSITLNGVEIGNFSVPSNSSASLVSLTLSGTNQMNISDTIYSSIKINGAGTLSVNGGMRFDGGKSFTLDRATVAISGQLYISMTGSSFNVNSGKLYVGTNIYSQSNININSGTVFVGGSIDGGFTLNGDAVLYAKTINGNPTYTKGIVYTGCTISNMSVNGATVTGGTGKIYGDPNVSNFIKPTGSSLGCALTADNIGAIPDVAYTGTAALPNPTVTVNRIALGGEKTLVQDTDYTVAVTSTNTTNVGSATATITGIGGFSGTLTKEFNIVKSDDVLSTGVDLSDVKENTTYKADRGTIQWEPTLDASNNITSGKLTLTDATITTGNEEINGAIGLPLECAIELVVNGTNAVSHTGNRSAINGDGIALTMTGSGTLTTDGYRGKGIDVGEPREGQQVPNIADTVRFNGLLLYTKGSSTYGTVYGSVTSAKIWRPLCNYFTVDKKATLTVPEGAIMSLKQNASGTVTNNGTWTNNGAVVLPNAIPAVDIPKLKLTGTGEVNIGNNFYNNEGVLLRHFSNTPLTFSAATEDAGNLTDDGYHWDNASKTLTLKNLWLEVSKDGSAITLPDDAKLVLQGTSTVIAKNSAICAKGNLTISGADGILKAGGTSSTSGRSIEATGTLTVDSGTILSAGNNASMYANAIEIKAGTIDLGAHGMMMVMTTLTISGGNVTTGDNEASMCAKDIVISGGMVKTGASIQGSISATNLNGGTARTSINITGGTVIANGGNSPSTPFGILAMNGTISITENAVVTATGRAAAILTSDGTITDTGMTAATTPTGGKVVSATVDMPNGNDSTIQMKFTSYTADATLQAEQGMITNACTTVSLAKTQTPPVTPSVTSVTVSPKTASIQTGKTQQLTANVVVINGADKTVTWKSSDATKATVDASGLVTAVAAGTVTITATSTVDGTKSDSAAVTVTSANSGGSSGGDSSSGSTGGGDSSSGSTGGGDSSSGSTGGGDSSSGSTGGGDSSSGSTGGGDDDNSSGSGSTATPTPAPTPKATDGDNDTQKPKPTKEKPTVGKTTAAAEVDAQGKATVTVPEKSINDAIKNAQQTAKKNGTEQNGISVEIEVNSGENINSVSTTLSEESIKELTTAGVKEVTFKSKMADVTLDLETLQQIQKEQGGDVAISVSKADTSNLDEKTKAEIGDRPVYELNLTRGDGTRVTNFDGSITISIPYTLQEGEDPANIAVVYINENGEKEIMSGSGYDEKTQSVIFTTRHFSTFAIVLMQDKIDAPITDIVKADETPQDVGSGTETANAQGGISTGIMVTIVIAAILAIAIVAGGIFVIVKKRRE